MSIFTHPANLPGWITHHEGKRFYCLCYHRPCPNKSKFPDLVTTYNGSICSNGGSRFNQCLPVLIFTDKGTTGIDHISENHGRPQKDIIFAYNAGINGNIVLYFYIVS